MPRGHKNNGSRSELAKAYVHGRIHATRDLLTAEFDKKLNRQLDHELTLWSYRFSLNPLELKQELGAIPFGAQVNRLPSSGMQQATGERDYAMAALEVVERTHGHSPSSSPNGGTSEDTANQVNSVPAPRRRLGVTGWFNKDGSPMTPEQRKKESRKRMLKRKDPLATMMLKGFRTTKPKQTQEKEKALDKPAEKKNAEKERKRKWWREHRGKDAPNRDFKQKIYVKRSLMKAKGVPESEWPPLPPKDAPQQSAV